MTDKLLFSPDSKLTPISKAALDYFAAPTLVSEPIPNTTSAPIPVLKSAHYSMQDSESIRSHKGPSIASSSRPGGRLGRLGQAMGSLEDISESKMPGDGIPTRPGQLLQLTPLAEWTMPATVNPLSTNIPVSGWLCGAGNSAIYGSCVASAFDHFEVLGPPQDGPLLHPGLPFAVTVLKLDAYRQTVSTDSVSLIQAVPVGPDGRDSMDNSTSVTGTVVKQLAAGRADFVVGVLPSYQVVEQSQAVTVLLHPPRLLFEGLDAESLAHISSSPLDVELATGAKVCPNGYVLHLGAPGSGSARPAGCVYCGPGTYSTSPLAGQGEPACYSCPVSGVCSGGADVQFSVGVWAVSGGIYRLLSCPPGHALVNSAAPGGPFDQSLQQCSACSAHRYVLDSSLANMTCQQCPLGAFCDGSMLTSLVPGAVWTADWAAGTYKLQSCPPGYELLNLDPSGAFQDVLQQCSLCPPGFFCAGGQACRAVCPDGTFTKSGANSSAACRPSVSVAVTVTLPIPEAQFTTDRRSRFREALADAAGVVPDQVLMRQVLQTRRAGNEAAAVGGSVQILSYIEAPDAAAAATVTTALSTGELKVQLERQGLPQGILNYVAIVRPASVGGGDVSWALVGSLVAAAVVALLVAALAAGRMLGRKEESAKDRELRLAVAALRTRLGIRREDGWLLSSEQRSVMDTGTMRGFLRLQHAEAAARLGLTLAFDLHQFNSFCLCLEESILPIKSYVGSFGRCPSSGARVSSGVGRLPSAITNMNYSFSRSAAPDPYARLCDWLLEVSSDSAPPSSVLTSLERGAATATGRAEGCVSSCSMWRRPASGKTTWSSSGGCRWSIPAAMSIP